MRHFIAGTCVGILLGSAIAASAGWFYSPQKLLAQRGGPCGDTLVTGYVAGVFDLMAAWYPPTQDKLGVVKDEALQDLLRNSVGQVSTDTPYGVDDRRYARPVESRYKRRCRTNFAGVG